MDGKPRAKKERLGRGPSALRESRRVSTQSHIQLGSF